MNLFATVSWNPKRQFKQADLVDIVLSFENGESKEFRGQFKRADTTMGYLWYLYVRATKDFTKKRQFVGKVVENTKGKRVYRIPVSVTNDDLDQLRDTVERVQKKHFIASRGETVTDEEYCKFFGSSGNLWNIDKCDYPRGDFVETLRQTVYDMEHGKPKIYTWTNVPKEYLLESWMESDPRFKAFAEKNLIPLVSAYWKGSRIKPDVVKKQLTRIAEVAEKYKREHGMGRV